MKKNFTISITMRPSEICNGPKCGLMENKCTSFNAENMFAPANKPSAINCGSKSSQCSRAMYAVVGSFRISADCWMYATPLRMHEHYSCLTKDQTSKKMICFFMPKNCPKFVFLFFLIEGGIIFSRHHSSICKT